MPKAKEFRFEVAISFAGEHRDKVRAIAEYLSEKIDPSVPDRSKGRVFFDEWFEHEILGDDMDVLLQRIYHLQSRLVVADISEAYAGRPWCQAEARAIRALRFDLDPARDETGRLRLLSAKFKDGDVPGVFKTTAYLDANRKTVRQCGELIVKRHELLVARMDGLSAVPASTLRPARATRANATPPIDISRIDKYAPAELLGREVEIALLSQAWADVEAERKGRPHVLTFVALGGEGKTSLVAKWAADLAAQDWPGCHAVFAWSFYSQGTRDQVAANSDLFLKEALAFFGDETDREFAAITGEMVNSPTLRRPLWTSNRSCVPRYSGHKLSIVRRRCRVL